LTWRQHNRAAASNAGLHDHGFTATYSDDAGDEQELSYRR